MGKIVITKMVRPMMNRIITTADKYKTDTMVNGIIDTNMSKGKYKDIQRVVAIGPMVRGIEVGDIVSLSFERYKERQYKNSLKQDDPELQKMTKGEVYYIPTRIIDGKEYFFLGDNDVEFIIPEGGCEEIEDEVPSSLIDPGKQIIL